MGVNAVVIVENRHGISFEEFARGLEADEWGIHGCNWEDRAEKSWEQFEWEGNTYFTWTYTPRTMPLVLYEREPDCDDPDFENPVQLTFLKLMLVVERLAGGPIYIGADVLDPHRPEDKAQSNREFSLPDKLDLLMPNWRKANRAKPERAYLVF